MLIEARLRKKLDDLRMHGSLPLSIELWNGKRYELGDPAGVTVRVPHASALRYFINADLAKLGEAYVEGHIDVDGPIDEVLRAAAILARRLGGDKPGRRPLLRLNHTRKLDADAISYHYDVSNDFYALWLDRNMVYSCAYFKVGDEDIHTAQEQKLDHVCKKLQLVPGDRLLDIGCGWGALARWAAKHYGVDATGITLSRNQHALANARIRVEGLEDRCRVLLQDYRDVPGQAVYDKIASIGMFEHVGLKNLPVYFGKIHGLLKEGGIVLNHGITSVDPDSRSVGLGAGDFVGKYVFPHGELPHLSLVTREMGAANLEVMDVETLRLHYAKTLWHWSARARSGCASGAPIWLAARMASTSAGPRSTRCWR